MSPPPPAESPHAADVHGAAPSPAGADGTPPVLAQVADALPWPLLLLCADARLLYANQPARLVLQRGHPLCLDDERRVQPTAPDRQAAFTAALQQGRPALLRWPDTGAVAVSPLGSNGSTGLRASAGSMDPVTPRLLALPSPSASHAELHGYARLHGFTAAETRALERLAQGDDTRRAAIALGLAPATLRSQAAAMRRKAGHRSIDALLRDLAAMPPLAALHLVLAGAGDPGR
jgi:DNA-binding CsgD family transcriptional regulator